MKQKPHYDFDMPYGNVYDEKLSAVQAIRHHCWHCQGGHEDPWPMSDGSIEPPLRPYEEVRDCGAPTCYLFPFRTGRDPNRAHHKGNADVLRAVPQRTRKG